METAKPGSGGEHTLQEQFGTFKRAAAFYDKQMLDHLNPLMREYIAQMEMVFIATADAHGECDTSFRAGSPGFVRVIDERTVMYPEYRGNGVMASLGNISENGHVGLLFVDFFRSTVGLHVNGTARIIENDAVTAFAPLLERMAGVGELHDQVEDKKKTPERWVLVEVVEMLRDFEHQAVALVLGLERVEDLRQMTVELDVDDRANDLGDLADGYCLGHCDVPYPWSASAPEMISMSSVVIAACRERL